MRKGKFTKKILQFKETSCTSLSGLQFDEYWLCAYSGSTLMFWNCVSDEMQKYQMPFPPYYAGYLSSTPNQIPDFAASDSLQKLYYKVNNTSKTVLIADLDIARQSGLYQFVAPLSSKKFIVGRGQLFF